jgi:hypothetical protein
VPLTSAKVVPLLQVVPVEDGNALLSVWVLEDRVLVVFGYSPDTGGEVAPRHTVPLLQDADEDYAVAALFLCVLVELGYAIESATVVLFIRVIEDELDSALVVLEYLELIVLEYGLLVMLENTVLEVLGVVVYTGEGCEVGFAPRQPLARVGPCQSPSRRVLPG